MGELRGLALLGAIAGLLAAAGLAIAETSSWESRVDGPAAPIEKKKPATAPPGVGWGPVKIIKTAPAPSERAAPPAAAPPRPVSAVVKTPAPVEDAAYEAFD